MYGHVMCLVLRDKTRSIALMKLCSRNLTLSGFRLRSSEVAMSLNHPIRRVTPMDRCLGLSLTPQREVGLPERIRDIQVEVVITARILEQTSLDATVRNNLNTASTRRSGSGTQGPLPLCVCPLGDRAAGSGRSRDVDPLP